ncbi:LiaF transmembrane domain-containing protein [Pedobacter sp. AW31-3R]|uniref:LiaF transmembrane domain-containing protein n=1 Tax=Pedobacter sp. AW31-3R TaxID=3445781 RepID=UPI003FA0E74B
MKLNRVMWGIILLFVGIVLLLENFNIIEFYWRNVWSFWPVVLIISGVNILFNKNKSQTGNMISLGVLVIMLGFVFYKGQQPPAHRLWFGENFAEDFDINIDDHEDTTSNTEMINFSEPFIPLDTAKKNILNISGGGTSFDLDGGTDSLIVANVERRNGRYTLQKETSDSVNTLTFKMADKKGKWEFNDGGNKVDFKLNKTPEWNINMNMGAGAVDFDLSEYKVRSFRFDGGAASLDIMLGDLLPITDVVVKTGVADVKIRIPEGAGCRIKTKTGLSAKDFEGFNKIDNSNYETSNYKASTKKIFINLDGGLSNFEVSRY